MLIAFNIVILALVALIAYWWANQGLFSAILHLACVIVAGAVALAVWEPITVGLLLRGNMFDDYAWGTVLIGTFVLVLVVLRVVMDKLIPGNVDLPNWANLTFGFPVGAVAGVLTMGIFVIGAGHIQSTNDIMGFRGMARADRGATIETLNALWAPVHTWTYEFYSFLSVGSLYPTFEDTPLRQYDPQLDAQAASLLRDSAVNGQAKFSLRPDDAHIETFMRDSAANRYIVNVQFEAGARDSGEQLTLSSSQIRLIGSASDFDEPVVVHPDQWTQYDGHHRFDDVSHYVTSEPGQSQASVVLEFPAAPFNNVPPRFIQIRGTRYQLPPMREGSTGSVAEAGPGVTVSVDRSARNIQSAIELTNSINPVAVSTNQMPPGIEATDDRFIAGGFGEFITGGGERPSRKLMLQGIFEPPSTRIIELNVSRESKANLFDARDTAPAGAKIMLVDSEGRPYYPVGYIHTRTDNRTLIKVDFQHYLPTMDDIPSLPTAGGQVLKLLFSVTEGATIVGFKLGDQTIGTCNLAVPASPNATPAATKTPPAATKPPT